MGLREKQKKEVHAVEPTDFVKRSFSSRDYSLKSTGIKFLSFGETENSHFNCILNIFRFNKNL